MINPNIDIAAEAENLKATKRLQINDFLIHDEATKLMQCLKNEIQWSLAYFDHETSDGATIPSETLKTMPKEELQALTNRVLTCGPDEYQFLYASYMMVTAYMAKQDLHLYTHRFLEYVNTPVFLEIMRRLTGHQDIIKMDAQATYYDKGHFLKQHNDDHTDRGRRMAYVLSLTENWVPDWGGTLQFVEDGKIVDTFVPTFNSLTIFEVPQQHYVSMVTPYAGKPRYSITGWMYAK